MSASDTPYPCIECNTVPTVSATSYGRSKLCTIECRNADCKTRPVVQALTPQEALQTWNRANAIKKGQWY